MGKKVSRWTSDSDVDFARIMLIHFQPGDKNLSACGLMSSSGQPMGLLLATTRSIVTCGVCLDLSGTPTSVDTIVTVWAV
jgi:hypothetical protein